MLVNVSALIPEEVDQKIFDFVSRHNIGLPKEQRIRKRDILSRAIIEYVKKIEEE